MTKLTKKLIDDTALDQGEIILWDHTVPGFGVRVKASGRKTFVIQYRNAEHRSRRLTIGRYGVMTLEQARKVARKKLSDVDGGDDPVEDAILARNAITVKELAKRYMGLAKQRDWKPTTVAAHDWLLNKFILPRFGNRRINAVSKRDVRELHASLGDTPYNANRTIGLLKAMFNAAERWELLPPHANPAVGVDMYKEKGRTRPLTEAELKTLTATLATMETEGSISSIVANAYRLLILTGARLSEVRTLRWHSVDFDSASITLQEHKTDRISPKVIPLSDPALAVLSTLREAANEDAVFVFPGAKPDAPIVNLQKPWRRVRSRAGLDDVRLHDLRHTFASFSVAAGIPFFQVGKLLGHNSLAATSMYAHLADTHLRQMANLVGTVIGEKVFDASVSDRTSDDSAKS